MDFKDASTIEELIKIGMGGEFDVHPLEDKLSEIFVKLLNDGMSENMENTWAALISEIRKLYEYATNKNRSL